MKITKIKYYGGAQEKVCRLGLSHLFLELQDIIFNTEIKVLEKKQANSAAVVRESLDKGFSIRDNWIQKKSGGTDWVKRIRYNDSIISRIGVEIQVSGRSDSLSRDFVHLRNDLQDSTIDIGIIVVPDDAFEYYLTDRVANYTYATRYAEFELKEAINYPIIIIAIEHDSFSDTALPKRRTNLGKNPNKK